jgi:hypothetical protein
MARSHSGTRRLGRWLILGIAVCICGAAVMSTQGCCTWYATHCSPVCPPVEHIVAIFEIDGKPCAAPGTTVAKRGEWVLFVNATTERVTIKAPVDYSVFEGLEENNVISLGPNEARRLTVNRQAPLHRPFTFVFEPRLTCPGYPGPGMDIDG